MDPNSLYWSFSTISQTLAGAMGLLAALGVLRLSQLEAVVEDARELSGLCENGGKDFLRLWWSGDRTAALGTVPEQELGKDPHQRARQVNALHALDAIRDLKGATVQAIVANGLAIAYSIVCLGFVPAMTSRWWLCAGLALTAAALVTLGRVVIVTLRR